jgi:molybdopterin-containing oxidoreductase family iron-sulfur binding subunit
MSNFNRRDFLKVAGATSATAAVGCNDMAQLVEARTPIENVLPYVVQPDQVVPGVATYFASTCTECTAGCGTLLRNREGRVVHVEGNPDHPHNLGGTCSVGVQALQGTYSPDRFEGPMDAGMPAEWDALYSDIAAAVKTAASAGKKIAWVGYPTPGSLGDLISQFMTAAGGEVAFWDPLGDDALRSACQSVFGIDALPNFELDDAHTILSFGMDYIGTAGDVPMHRGWANSRDPKHGGFVSRTICVEPKLGNTSCMADLFLNATPGSEVGIAMAMARLVAEMNGYSGPASAFISNVDVAAACSAASLTVDRVTEIAGWIAEHPSVILPGGPTTSAAATDLAVAVLLLNEVAGNIGTSVHFGGTTNLKGRVNYGAVEALLAECAAGTVGVLFIDDLDLAHIMPGSIDVMGALEKVGTLVGFVNESTDSLTPSALVLPNPSSLEGWGGHEAATGWFTMQQPGMLPIKDCRSVGDSLLAIAKAAGLAVSSGEAGTDEIPADVTPDATLLDAIPAPDLTASDFKAYLGQWWKAHVWTRAGRPGSFATFWTDCLRTGGWWGDKSPTGATVVLTEAPATTPVEIGGSGDLVVTPFAHLYIRDGRHANKPWAQEIPEPLSSFTWGSWAEVSPATAERLELDPDKMVVVETEQGSVELGWYANPGMNDGAVAVVLGGGKTRSGRYAKFGTNTSRILTARADAGGALAWTNTKGSVSQGTQQNLFAYIGNMDMDNRPLNFVVSKNDLGKGSGPGTIVPMHHVPIDQRLLDAGLNDMYPEPEHPTYRFAMAIDLNRCNGCGACETACYSENNIPVVGPDQIRLGRHMGWTRLSRYFEGSGEEPDVRFQPVMCQQCSHAPCEGVCPVLATYHNLDGLNAMIYNRCVGTRYCGNNCPYTARRFNYHSFKWPESYNLMLNPDVMTREMGVMEKCTFCVHKLREVKDRFRDNRYNGSGGPVVATEESLQNATACGSACPSGAITFGNLKNTDGAVYKAFQDERAYAMLGELNTKPGVRYLARINHTPTALHHGSGHGTGHGDSHDGDHGDSHGDSHGGDHGDSHGSDHGHGTEAEAHH